jgi:MFS family permease
MKSNLKESLLKNENEIEAENEFTLTTKEKVLLGCGFLVLFMQWFLMTFFSPFFANSAPGYSTSYVMFGWIYASFPLGTFVVAPQIGSIITTFGTRNTVILGLAMMGFFTILFGFIPIMTSTSAAMPYLLIVTGFAYGGGSTFAETGVYAVLSNAFSDQLGKVLAVSEVVTGLGSMLGPFFGGNIFDAFKNAGSDDQFAFTFLLFGTLPLITIMPIYMYMPQSYIGEEEEMVPLRDIFTLDTTVTAITTFMGAAAMNAMSPTLQIRLQTPPFQLSAGQVGATFLVSGVTYMALAFPLGVYVDRNGENLPGLRKVMGAGLLMIAVAFVMMGPLRLGNVDLDELNNLPAFLVGNVLWGLGQCLALIPSLPEMLAPHPEEAEGLRATITGVWIASYALGCAAGPVLSTILMGISDPALCRQGDGPVDRAVSIAAGGDGEAGAYSHCFDGFCKFTPALPRLPTTAFVNFVYLFSTTL